MPMPTPTRTPTPTRVSGAPATCDPKGLETAAFGVYGTRRIDWGVAVAAGLRIACGDRLPPEVRQAFADVERLQPDPARVAALPERVDQLVDVSRCSEVERERLAMAYAQLRRDARHRVSTRIRVIEARGGVGTREGDVEVSSLPEAIELDGAAVPDVGVLERRLSEQSSRQRLVLVIDQDARFGRLRELVTVGRRVGFAELGVLVVHEGVYRVLPLAVGTAERVGAVKVIVGEDGFFLEHGGEPPMEERPPEIPLVKPGAPLEDADRWDFHGLEERVAQWSSVGGARPRASLTADDEVRVRDVVAAAERVRGAECAEDGGGRCRVDGLEWVFR
jgi:hypothetical protein